MRNLLPMQCREKWWQSPLVHLPLIIILFFVVSAPTLRWQDFSDGMETFNVLTAVETIHEGHWLVPTLDGAPRLQKPPFTHWITAAGILSSDSLEWGSRWPSLLMACLMLAGVYDLGRTIRDWRLGLLSAIVCGTCLLFGRYSSKASYDIQLAMWVVLANAAVARAIFRAQRWGGLCAAGLALGGALMTKGPPALAETILPVGLFVGWDLWRRRRGVDAAASGDAPAPAGATSSGGCRRGWWGPVLAGLAITAAISVPWVAYVLRTYSLSTLRMWVAETRLEAEQGAGDTTPRWVVFVFLPQMLPWTVWLLIGCVVMFLKQCIAPLRQAMFILLLTVAPLACLAIYPPVRDRYMTPMAGPAAVIAAWAMLQCLSQLPLGRRPEKLAITLHWLTIGVLCVGLPLMGAGLLPPLPRAGRLTLESVDHSPWFTPAAGLGLAAAAAVVLGVSIRLQRRHLWAAPAGTLVLLLSFQFAYDWGHSASAAARSNVKEPAHLIARRYPDAEIYTEYEKKCPREMGIYLGRTVRPLADGKWPARRDVDVVVLAREQWVGQNAPADAEPLVRFEAGRFRWLALGRRAAKE